MGGVGWGSGQRRESLQFTLNTNTSPHYLGTEHGALSQAGSDLGTQFLKGRSHLAVIKLLIMLLSLIDW